MSVEERVRAALAVRAGQVTVDRLQPAMPPTTAMSRPARRVRWLPMLAAAAAAVAVLFTVILLIRPGAEVPAGPVLPTPSPASPAPQPAKKSPPAVPPNENAPRPKSAPAPGGSPAGGSQLSPVAPQHSRQIPG